MSKWEELTLTEAGITLIDCDHKTPPPANKGLPYVAIPQMKDGYINFSDARLISAEDFEIWTRKANPQVHDVVLSRRCNPGESAYVAEDMKFALGQNLVLLRSDGKLVKKPFLRWLIKSPAWWSEVIRNINVGAVFNSLKCGEIVNFKLPIPPIEEQERITKTLSSLDRKIENLRRQNETLERIAQTLFKHWFVDFEFPNADGKPYKSSGGAMETSELGEIPVGWRVGKLDDFCDIKHGYAFKGEFITPKETDQILLTPGNFRIGGGFNPSKYKYYSDDGYDKEYVLETGNLVITMTDLSKEGDTLGYPALIPRNRNKFFLHNQRLGKIIDSQIDLFFLFFLLCRREYRSHILGSASGSTVRHTSPSRILEYKFTIPDRELLEKFSSVTRNLIGKTFANQEQIETLTDIRDVLLPKLMSGQIRIGK